VDRGARCGDDGAARLTAGLRRAAAKEFDQQEIGVAAFHPFLYGDQGRFPERNANEYRVASYVGALGSDHLVPGPVLDTDSIDDVHMILLLAGLKLEEMQAIRRNDGEAARFAWLGFGPILSITAEITFALEELAAREFLLDLRNAVEMMNVLRPDERGGCMIEILLPHDAR
jgi:hypothetical protein